MWPFYPTPEYEIRGKVAVVTGALGAIGKTIALQLIDQGARVALIDMLDNGTGEDFCREINGLSAEPNITAAYVQANLRNLEEIERALQAAVNIFGQIDILVNNAGVASTADFFVDQSSESVSEIIDVNLRAPMESTRLFVKMIMAGGRQGVVVNIASIAALSPVKRFEVYGTTKTALVFFTETCVYLDPQVRVTGVAPFFVNSPLAFRDGIINSIAFVNRHTLISATDVSHAVVRQIKDKGSAGKTVMLVGAWGSLPVWQFKASGAYAMLAIYLCWFSNGLF
ncbi:hypothetical protein GGI07_002322 [Coemansia sp. Benny D115]|nr:hypothetical protein GGI07_002322 [Coemansia sp. Benny D115]